MRKSYPCLLWGLLVFMSVMRSFFVWGELGSRYATVSLLSQRMASFSWSEAVLLFLWPFPSYGTGNDCTCRMSNAPSCDSAVISARTETRND